MSNPFKHFLGIDTDPKAPDLYLVFKIEEHANAEQVAKAADAVIAKVRAQRPGEKKREWSALIDFLTKAKHRLIAERRVISPATVFDPPSVAASEKKATPAKPTNQKAASKPSKRVSGNSQKTPIPKVVSSPKTNALPPATPIQPQPPTHLQHAVDASILPKKNVANRKTNQPKVQLKEAGTSPPTHDDDFSFALDAPDEKDSFDSDTHLSGHSLQPVEVMATTIDPMAPVADPTLAWDSFDLNEFNQATISPAVHDQKVREFAQPSAAVSEKTFYTDSYRTKSRNGIMIGGTLIAMLVVGAISYLIIFGIPNGNSPDTDQLAANDQKSTPKTTDAKNNNSVDKSSKALTNNDNQDDSTDQKKDNDVGNSNGTPTQKQPSSSVAKKTTSDSMKSEPSAPPMPSVDPMPTPAPKPSETNPDAPNPDSMTPDSDGTETKTPEPKNSEIAELALLLTSVREKLSERDIVEANRILDKAASLPMVAEHKQKFERLKSVTDLYGKFWNMVVEGCGKLKGLDEIKFSDTNIIKVVESSEDRIVYRAIGKRFEKEPRELQIGIAMKIAEKEFDEEAPESRLIKGSVYAVEAFKDSDRADRAKELWEEAALLGTNTDELILFLDDDYDLLAGFIKKAKPPEPDESKAAQERFRTTYASELKTASKNSETSMAFATQLLADAPTLDDASDRHANFVAAVFYASKSGNTEFLMKSLSDLNKWFSIDLDQKTFDALTTMNKSRLKPDQKREVARTAFEYMDRAKRAENKELELKFANLALSAAKGTRDQKFIATATAELNRVKSSQ